MIHLNTAPTMHCISSWGLQMLLYNYTDLHILLLVQFRFFNHIRILFQETHIFFIFSIWYIQYQMYPTIALLEMHAPDPAEYKLVGGDNSRVTAWLTCSILVAEMSLYKSVNPLSSDYSCNGHVACRTECGQLLDCWKHMCSNECYRCPYRNTTVASSSVERIGLQNSTVTVEQRKCHICDKPTPSR